MLTPKQNLLETIHGGNPDRFVNQYDFLKIVMGDPISAHSAKPKYGELNVVDAWGITRSYPENCPGAFPVHTPDKIVCKDVAEWEKYVKAPNIKYDDDEWAPYVEAMNAVNRDEHFACVFSAPGLFEWTHYLMEMQNALMAYYEEPEAMKDMIKYVRDYMIAVAEEQIKHAHPNALFQHDDWGSQISTFLSPAMFEDFFLDAYKELYGFWKANGIELICHHSDSYAETLVPYMVEMGIDIWQGTMTTNDINKIIDEYGGKLTIMGGIDSATIDHPGWTRDEVKEQVEKACRTYGTQKKYFIPSASQGLPMSTFEGVYEATTEEIDRMSKIMFG